MSSGSQKPKLTYAESGVDLKAGDSAVEKIKTLANKTFDKRVLSEIGTFCGFFKPDLTGIKNPVLVSSADGVGTKLKLAFMTGKHGTIGEDLVNHCVNDILVHGAHPLFFMDYIATGKLEPEIVAEIVSGMSRGCVTHQIALLGGETAEMPDFYKSGEYDVAGFIIGIIDEEKVVNGSTIVEGDVVLGLESNGLHTNGYSLARKVIFDLAGHKADDKVDQLESTIAEILMQVHIPYYKFVYPLLKDFEIHGMAHITGGGIPGNLKRILPKNFNAEINTSSWPRTKVFSWLKEIGNLDEGDMFKAFNMGIGYIIVCDQAAANGIRSKNPSVHTIGKIVQGAGQVELIS